MVTIVKFIVMRRWGNSCRRGLSSKYAF